MDTASDSRAVQAFKYARTVIGLLVAGAVAWGIIDHQRYLNHSVRLTWPKAVSEIDGIISAVDGEKTAEPRIAKAQATVFVVEGRFRRSAGPMTVAEMDGRLATQGWKPGKRVRVDDRVYCKGDNVAKLGQGNGTDYIVWIEWGSANGMCERR